MAGTAVAGGEVVVVLGGAAQARVVHQFRPRVATLAFFWTGTEAVEAR